MQRSPAACGGPSRFRRTVPRRPHRAGQRRGRRHHGVGRGGEVLERDARAGCCEFRAFRNERHRERPRRRLDDADRVCVPASSRPAMSTAVDSSEDRMYRGMICAWLLCPIVVVGCFDAGGSLASNCVVDPNLQCGGGFDGFDCPSGRPDENAVFGKGSIQGIVCTDLGQVRGDGTTSYCCTSATTTCGYDPSAGCPSPSHGYACMAPDRPETFDPTLYCGTGAKINGQTVFCCGATSTAPCNRNSSVQCVPGNVGFECNGTDIPNQSEQGTNQSRSDATLICDIPAPMGNGLLGYCCYTPSPTPIGSTCLQDQAVSPGPTLSLGFVSPEPAP